MSHPNLPQSLAFRRFRHLALLQSPHLAASAKHQNHTKRQGFEVPWSFESANLCRCEGNFCSTMRILQRHFLKQMCRFASQNRVRMTHSCLAAREPNTQVLRQCLSASFPVSRLEKSALVCALPQKNPSKIHLPQDASSFQRTDFSWSESNFLRNM